ncbi:MAG: MBL fold metallo-hydrolase [Chitinophagaceae bacterium]|nr:MBL fold metallo-hydrolase [Chitinophagaceae bacterium]
MKSRKISKDLYVDWHSVAPGIWRIRDIFVNIYLVHNTADNTWVLIDAGLPGSAKKIKKVASELFWPAAQPSAILLTHAHFDHTGSLRKLADEWDVPVYAHIMEKPYLTGASAYPPPDPFAGGGLMSLISFSYPKGPIDISDRFVALPADGSVPYLPGWKYVHTPGHAPGHVSFFRQSDRVLIAGDAFVTTDQESALSVMLQKRKLQGPPKYFTYNWGSAERSVKLLAALEPSIAVTGHGKPMEGEEMRQSLHDLADHFADEAVPSSGRYTEEPALVNLEGVQYVPPFDNRKLILPAAAIAAAVALGIFLITKSRRRHQYFS